MGDYSLDEVEAALCVWEYMLETKNPYWRDTINRLGVSSSRVIAIGLGAEIQQGYELYNGEERYDDPFDWEFIPRVMQLIKYDSPRQDINVACLKVIRGYEEGLKNA